ncbi:MAG: nucleotidyltransferase domain-containing protein [Spirochaetaceae bacterium]|nr:nucleotidyltransferase domain-containing protein [Spirochaetaceae bacterium]
MDSKDTLEIITSIIKKAVKPEKIILFGSRATNSYSNDSDFDICVVVENLDDERQLAREINREIFNKKLEVPVDVIAVDSKKYKQNMNRIGFIYKQIQENGVVVYAS